MSRFAAGLLLAMGAIGCLVPRIDVTEEGSGGGGAGGEGGQHVAGGTSSAPCESLFEGDLWPASCAACVASDEAACSWASYCLASTACQRGRSCLEGDLSPGGLLRCRRDEPEGYSYESTLEVVTERCTDDCFGRQWSCVANWAWPAPSTGTGFITLRLRDAAQGEPIAEVSTRACGASDLDCATPLDEAASTSSGAAALSVAYPFDGFFEAEPPVGYPPWRLFRPRAVADQILAVDLPDDATLASWAASVGATIDPARAQVLVVVDDCTETQAPGIALELTPVNMAPSAAHYLDGASIDVGASATNRGGRGVFVDQPVGSATLRARQGGDEVARRVVSLRAGLNLVELYPLRQ